MSGHRLDTDSTQMAEATTQLDRTDWGILGGKPAVGADVNITINIEAIKQ